MLERVAHSTQDSANQAQLERELATAGTEFRLSTHFVRKLLTYRYKNWKAQLERELATTGKNVRVTDCECWVDEKINVHFVRELLTYQCKNWTGTTLLSI